MVFGLYRDFFYFRRIKLGYFCFLIDFISGSQSQASLNTCSVGRGYYDTLFVVYGEVGDNLGCRFWWTLSFINGSSNWKTIWLPSSLAGTDGMMGYVWL